jgi:hypothetical protein
MMLQTLSEMNENFNQGTSLFKVQSYGGYWFSVISCRLSVVRLMYEKNMHAGFQEAASSDQEAKSQEPTTNNR